VTFGDDTPMPDEVLTKLAEYMVANRSAYRWSPGRFVIVDNTVSYHSRQPFAGRRRVFASIGKGSKPVADTTTHLVLSNGDKMPMAGLGLWKMPKDSCADAVVNAVEAGYRLFDSAADYGNEKQTGEGIKRVLDAGTMKREDLFVVSKLWNTYHRPEHVKAAVKKSLADLGLEYLDLYLIHFPIPLKYVPIEKSYPPEWIYFDEKDSTPRMEFDQGVTYQQTWEAMEELVKEGLVRNIGACNVGVSMLRQVL
jgi:D-xylose reductase